MDSLVIYSQWEQVGSSVLLKVFKIREKYQMIDFPVNVFFLKVVEFT